MWLDWWGPFNIPSLKGGYINILIAIDEVLRKTWVWFGTRKDLYKLFIKFKNTVELETGLKIKVCWCNNKLEFIKLDKVMES